MDGRNKSGHDGGEMVALYQHRHGRACPGHPRLAYFAYGGLRLHDVKQARRHSYVGVTSDLPKRAYEHRSGIVAGFTKRYGLKRLIWFEQCDDIRSAIQREKTMKHWPRAWKVRLINAMNPEWRDLYDELM